MNISYFHKKDLEKTVRKKFLKADSLIDIGCGIRPTKLINSKRHICIEPYFEYVNELTKLLPYHKYILINSTWDNALKLFPSSSIDTIYFADLIEHLTKEEGLKLINEAQRIARKQVILFTPLGYLPQSVREDEKDAWGYSGGKYQEHKSGWDLNDFDSSWQLFCTEEFHYIDHEGNKFKKPYGAFWAIKNIQLKRVTKIQIIKYKFFTMYRNYGLRIKTSLLKTYQSFKRLK